MHVTHFLKTRELSGEDTFCLQIGAMDGTTTDHMHRYLTRLDWRALLVEPVPEYFTQLQKTYAARPNVRLANVVVAGHSGQVPFYSVDPAAMEAGLVPPWGRGASSLYPDRTALGWADVKPHVRRQMLPCLTLPDLLDQYGVSKIDVLQIDAEGHDYQILKQLDFSKFSPFVINIEYVNLLPEEQDAVRNLLTANGYHHEKKGYDLVAAKRRSDSHES
ncbi:MAG: FkbM family methyltransferase [Proteobacteria bacterium]|nr:FkbM family methyltransferase [Pseudomonadota bacterium]